MLFCGIILNILTHCKTIIAMSLAHSVASPASGHVGTCPPGVRDFFSLYVETSCLVWFGTMTNFNAALQPHSLWNDTITGYNGACAKVNVTFTA